MWYCGGFPLNFKLWVWGLQTTIQPFVHMVFTYLHLHLNTTPEIVDHICFILCLKSKLKHPSSTYAVTFCYTSFAQLQPIANDVRFLTVLRNPPYIVYMSTDDPYNILCGSLPFPSKQSHSFAMTSRSPSTDHCSC